MADAYDDTDAYEDVACSTYDQDHRDSALPTPPTAIAEQADAVHLSRQPDSGCSLLEQLPVDILV
jgi:hypothetical protein